MCKKKREDFVNIATLLILLPPEDLLSSDISKLAEKLDTYPRPAVLETLAEVLEVQQFARNHEKLNSGLLAMGIIVEWQRNYISTVQNESPKKVLARKMLVAHEKWHDSYGLSSINVRFDKLALQLDIQGTW